MKGGEDVGCALRMHICMTIWRQINRMIRVFLHCSQVSPCEGTDVLLSWPPSGLALQPTGRLALACLSVSSESLLPAARLAMLGPWQLQMNCATTAYTRNRSFADKE